jgi:hypothetical protein
VNGAELFTVGREADERPIPHHRGHLLDPPLLFEFDAAQDAVTADDGGRPADLLFRLVQGMVQAGHHVQSSSDPQHQAGVDGAEEGQAPVVVDLLDGAHEVLAADAEHDRVRGEHHRSEFVDLEADGPGVLLGGGAAVDLGDDPMTWVGAGDDQPGVGGLEVLRLEGGERQRSLHHGEHGGVAGEAAVCVDRGLLESEPVAGRAADERDFTEGVAQ